MERKRVRRLLFFLALFFLCSACGRRKGADGTGESGAAEEGKNPGEAFLEQLRDKDGVIPLAQADYISEAEFKEEVERRLGREATTVYDLEYQEAAEACLKELREKKTYTAEAPLLVSNPFGTNTTGVYLYFTGAGEEAAYQYAVVELNGAYAPFVGELIDINPAETDVEAQVIGLTPGAYNLLCIYGQNASPKEGCTYLVELEKSNTIKEVTLQMTKNKEESLAEGLFVLFGYDRRNENEPKHLLFYDNDGLIRAEIPLDVKNADANLLLIDNHLFYPCAEAMFAFVNPLGRVERLYPLSGYKIHHDFDYDAESKTVVILADKLEKETKEDIILTLNLESGAVTETIDMETLLPDIKKRATLADNEYTEGKLDWIHLNSIDYIDGKDVIVSSRELSTIIRINNIHTMPAIRYFIADETIWKDTPYEGLLLKKFGTFTSQAGQHDVRLADKKTDGEGKYYLTLFNNNYGVSPSWEAFDWSVLGDIGLPKAPAENSYYYNYYVDENTNRYELSKAFSVPYSRLVSNAQQYGGHFVICSGMAKVFGEYDKEGSCIAEYAMQLESELTYRVKKYSLAGLWN